MSESVTFLTKPLHIQYMKTVILEFGNFPLGHTYIVSPQGAEYDTKREILAEVSPCTE